MTEVARGPIEAAKEIAKTFESCFTCQVALKAPGHIKSPCACFLRGFYPSKSRHEVWGKGETGNCSLLVAYIIRITSATGLRFDQQALQKDLLLAPWLDPEVCILLI